MKEYIVENKRFLFLIILWVIIGSFLPIAMWGVLPLSLFLLHRKGYEKELFLGFFIVLIFSDSRHPNLLWAQSLKNIYILLLFVFYLTNKKNVKNSNPIFLYFIPFLLIAIFCMFYSPTISSSFQKTLSYFMLIIVVSGNVINLIEKEGVLFLRSLVFMVNLLLISGFILYFVNYDVAVFVNRYRGILGNPNGMGVFTLIFFLVFNVLIDCYPNLFSKKERWLFYSLLFLSMVMNGSRGAIFGVLLFFITKYFYKKSNFLGFIVMLMLIFGYQYLTMNIESIVRAFGLAGYFRVDTLEDGSGRIIAWKYAWDQIQNNIFLGKGFDYTEYIFRKNSDYLSLLGHQGNAHNSYLTLWLDTGFWGLLAFLFGLVMNFYNASKISLIAFPVMYTILFSSSFESWLTGSLNPITIQIWIILAVLFYYNRNKNNGN